MKKYVLQLVFFTSIIELLLIYFFNFFNFTEIIILKNYFSFNLLNHLINLIILLIMNLLLCYFYYCFIKKNSGLIYFLIGLITSFIYFSLYKIFNSEEIIQILDIFTIILINIFKSYMICYSLFYNYLL